MYRTLGALFLLLFLFPLPCPAENATPSAEAPYSLDTLVVTAGRLPERLGEVSSHVEVITAEEIRRSPAEDVGDLLAERSLGHIQKTPGSLTSVGIRGFRTEALGNDLKAHVLVLLNGRRAGTGNLAKILTANVERIEIIRGPGSVQYGSAAVGGVINIITRRGRGELRLHARGELGSHDFKRATAGGEGEAGPLDFSAAATLSSRDDYTTADGRTYRNTGYDGKQWQSLHLGLTPGPGHRLSAVFTRFKADGVGTPDVLVRNDFDDHKDSLNHSLDLAYQGSSEDRRWTWSAHYFQGRDQDDFEFPAGSDPDGFDLFSSPFRLTNDFQGGQVQAGADFGLFSLLSGLDWVRFEQESTFDPRQTTHDNPALFALAKLRFLEDRLVVSGGLRYDHYEVEVEEPPGRSERDRHLTPRIGLSYLIDDTVKLRAAYGQAFVMPAPDQLAADYLLFGTRNLGNPDLDPETSATYEAGFDLVRGPLLASLTFFHTDFKDKIVRTTGPGRVITWENLGGAVIQGLEGSLSCELDGILPLDVTLQPHLTGVFLTRFEDEETGEDLPFTSKLQLSTGLTLARGPDFLSFNLAYTGRQDVEDFESGVFPAPVVQKGGFAVAGLTLSKQLFQDPDWGTLALRGEVENLFDRDFSYVKGYPMPGRSFFVGLHAELY